MVRTQILLDAEEHRRAKVRAAELGISLAEFVRRAVRSELAGTRPKPDPTEIIGLFDLSGSDIARHKDAYLAEAVGAKLTKNRTSGARRR